ncbi:NACHT domain-containing protein [Candidatus Nitrotoga arctica]|uniref:NACHT domain-containing protein n=1 Tax=Candidatus Nitrotoga arctica TaxID=453162 RepID=A0ABN8AMM4_9PROT|nr:NACHT domain-containing protein [Candidatus Nitrotoga arctica]CAG9931988.1 NACHT domain-containing protein [Candidatus Nitrotoga arctica]
MNTLAIAASVAALTLPLKDLYETGKHKFQEQLAKWNNAKNIKSLVLKVTAYEQVMTIWQREKKVKLSNFYYPSKVTFSTGVTKAITSLRDLPQKGALVIQGTVGQGKSIFLRYLCIQELSKSTGRIPIFFELRKLDQGLDIEKALLNTLESLGFEVTDALFDHYAASGKLVILLDGFDEIEESLVKNAITSLESWAVRYPQMQFIITSRPGGEIQKSSYFSIIQLAPLNADEHKAFLTKIGVKGPTLNHLLVAIEASPIEIRGLLTTPLLLTLLVLVYQSEGVIPNELPEFFNLLFTTVFVRHDRTKPAFTRKHKSGLNDKKLEQFFEAFCFAVMKQKFTVNLKKEQFQLAFDDAIKFSGKTCVIDGFVHDIIKVACLLQEDGLYTSFVHKSLLDYYPAAFIKSCTDEQSIKIYNVIAPLWRQWQHVLGFLSYIDKYRFTKYFAIPTIETFLDSYGVVNGQVTLENANTFIEKTFTTETHFSYVQEAETKEFVQKTFGQFFPQEMYFLKDIHWWVLEIHLLHKLPMLECAFTKTVEDGEERFIVFWKDLLLKPNMLNKLEQKAMNLLNELNSFLNEYKIFIKDEADKADLLSQFDSLISANTVSKGNMSLI